jgi:L-aspartate oxidase
MKSEDYDVLILGSGAAALSAALSMPDQKVAVATKSSLLESASNRAQGGIAAALGKDDSVQLHIADTLSCGVELCNEHAVQKIISKAPSTIAWLKAQGVTFTTTPDQTSLQLTQEGGHSRPRIVHANDFTGHAITTALLQKAKASPNIAFLENHMALGLASVGDKRQVRFLCIDREEHLTIHAKAVVLATGGAGQLFRYTTNPLVSTGDGIALAWRAGCRVTNLEFYQFHPTAFIRDDHVFLISEAVRGEGGVLITEDGKRFMTQHDPRGELAPRDIVARGIAAELYQGREVYLDITHKSRTWLSQRFPTIYAYLQHTGLDMSEDPIPVVPAAHYCCGGVVTDIYGRTDIAGIYAIGEVACTGLHGANRLASNSLLECIVMGRLLAKVICEEKHQGFLSTEEEPFSSPTISVQTTKRALQNLMWEHAGIIRNEKDLAKAQEEVSLLYQGTSPSSQISFSRERFELANLFTVASLLLQSAIFRRESRGAHMNRDYPWNFARALPTVLAPWTRSQVRQ